MLGDGIRPELIVVLSDINMPGMDGLGLLRKLKEQRADLPVIMVTAYGDDERRRKAAEFGAAEFVTKAGRFRPAEAAAAAAAPAVMTEAAKILAVDDEPDFELLIKQRFRQRIRAGKPRLPLRPPRRGGAGSVGRGTRHRPAAARHQHAGDGRAQLALRTACPPVTYARGDRLSVWRHGQYPHRHEPRRLRFRHQAGGPQRPRSHHRQDARDHRLCARTLDQQRAGAERARANLARYFSPNIVDLLAESDEPLGPVRRQTVGVLFVDIVGFTRMAEAMTPEAVVGMLRDFHEPHGGADLRLRRHHREIHRR